MKKLFTLLLTTIFSLAIFASPVFAGRGYGHSGRSGGHSGYTGHHYSGHSNRGYNSHHYSGHGHINGWEAAAIGLGAAVVGSAIINSYPREREVVVERNIYYNPPPPPRCRDYVYDCPSSYDPPPRVWVPGRYEYVGGGYYRRAPGHWE